MTPSDGMPRTTVAADTNRPRLLFGGLADGARWLLGRSERRAPGGISRNRALSQASTELSVPLSAFKMVGLGEVQAKLGERWPALSERVHLIAQNTISKHLIRGDVFERLGDDGYLVLFASLGVAEAEFKSRVIAKEIVEHLLGEGGAEGVRVSALCTEISATSLAGDDHEAALAEALNRATPPQESPASTIARVPADDKKPHAMLPTGPVGTPKGWANQDRLTTPEPAQDTPEVHAHTYSPVWDVTQMTLLRFRAGGFGVDPSGQQGRSCARRPQRTAAGRCCGAAYEPQLRQPADATASSAGRDAGQVT
jgi:hypothetical protein